MSADVIAAAPNPTAQPLPPAVAPRTHAWKAGKAAQVMPFRPPPRAMASSPAPTPLATAAAPQSPPADIARRMQEALDKYQRLEAQRAGTVDLRQ